jgi:hypothetical protein
LSQKLGQVQLPEADRLDAFLLARKDLFVLFGPFETYRTDLHELPFSGLAVEYFLLDPKLSEPDLEPNPNSAASTFLSLLSIEPDPSQRPSPIPAILNALLPLLSTPFLASLIARFQRNNHVLLSNDTILHPFAHVVLADVSRSVNHSCVPTALVSHKFGREVGVRTIRDLEEGDEVWRHTPFLLPGRTPQEINSYALLSPQITISYLDPILSISTRKKTLAHTYSFECICALCTSPPVNPFRPSHIPRPSLSPSSVQPSYPPIPTPTRPLPLSEKQITNLTVGFEEAHKDERWEQASSQGEKVLMVYWGAYGGYASPIIGTFIPSIFEAFLRASASMLIAFACHEPSWQVPICYPSPRSR